MTLTFTEDQRELARTVRAFLDQKSPETEVRRLMETAEGYDPAVWAQMADQLGLQGLVIPEGLSGSGFAFDDAAVVLEEMGRALLCAPYLATLLASFALLYSEDKDAQALHLPGIAAGDTIATVAVNEDAGRWSLDAITTSATRRGEEWAVSGTKSFVLDGTIADLVLVAARTSGGISVFAVRPGPSAAVMRSALSTMDQTRKLARLTFDNAPGILVGEEGDGRRVLERTLQVAAAALAAEQVGGAQRCLEMSVEYAKNRVQFGRPIGSFQAVKHRCADMLVAVEMARSAASYAAACVANDDSDVSVAAAMAKSYCSEAYYRIAADTIQVHGGIGFTWEHAAHLYFKRAKSSELLFGSPRDHRRLLAAELGLP